MNIMPAQKKYTVVEVESIKYSKNLIITNKESVRYFKIINKGKNCIEDFNINDIVIISNSMMERYYEFPFDFKKYFIINEDSILGSINSETYNKLIEGEK